jgi:hypothetical protein
MKRLLAALLLLAPVAALAGPYDQPWVIITTDLAPSPDFLLRPVIINRIDGETNILREAVAEPGLRIVTIDLPPRKGFSLGTQVNFELQANPCMRYNLAARLDNSVGQNWTPVVRSTETIGECLAKFKGGVNAK